eukprot:s1523_g10.t1
MVKVRRVYVVTSNPERVPEFQRLLQLYGIEACHASPFGYRTKRDGPQALLPLAEKLLEQNNEKFWTKSVMYEQVLLLCRGTELHADAPGRELVDGEPVTVRASLTVWSSQKGEQEKAGQVEVFVYRHEMDAKIDLSKRREDRCGVFNWDDVVVDLYSGLSYHEKKLMGFKVSPRDMMLSQYLQHHVHYRRRRLCRHNHLEVSRAVDFGDGSPALNFFRRNPYLFPETSETSASSTSRFFRRAFSAVLNHGLVLRAAMTRREFIYWLPGLNAGIPLVPKDDAIHEATFQAHDLAHFLLPDLLFTGEDSPLHRRLYIIYRMLSEAITLVFADMLFVEHLRRSGVEYDWSKRKIWPLFHSCQLDPFTEGSTEHFLSVFRALLEANVSYCLLGDDSRYRELLKADALEPECLKDFKEKYMPFFVEDFRWTSQNYRSMAARGAELRRWWCLAEPIRELLQQGPGTAEELLTVEEFANRLGCHGAEPTDGSALVWSAFRDVFTRRIAPIFQQEPQERSCGETLFRAFGRYMMGQCILLARFNFLPESKSCHEEILQILQEARDDGGALSEAQMLKARGCFESYVDLLLERQFITLDDAVTFKEVCPLFEPCFAAYDEPLEHYQQLKRVSQDILGELPSAGSEVTSAPKAGAKKSRAVDEIRLGLVLVFEQGADHKAAASYDPNRSYTIDIIGHGALAVKALGAVEIFDEQLIKFTGLRILCTGEDNWFDGKGWTGSRGDICKTLLGVIEDVASPTVEVHFDTTAEILDMMKGTVQTTSKTGDRAVHEFDVVVGADGAGSKLRGAMSKLPSFTMESINMENYSIMLHMDQNTSELDPGLLHIFGIDPLLVAGAINGKGGKSDPLWFCQVGFKGLEKGKWLQEASLKDLKTKLKKSGWPKSTDLLRYVSDQSLKDFQARMPQATGKGKVVSPWSHGRCVLLGDAGAPFPPIGQLAFKVSQGVNCGMEGALVLGEALVEGLGPGSGPLEAAVTKTFQAFTEKWKPQADAVTEISTLTDVGKFNNPLEVVKTIILTKINCGGVKLAKEERFTYQEALAAHKSGVRMLWLFFGLPALLVRKEFACAGYLSSDDGARPVYSWDCCHVHVVSFGAKTVWSFLRGSQALTPWGWRKVLVAYFMANDPSKFDQIWRAACEKEMLTWQSPSTLLKSLQLPLGPPEESGPFYRAPSNGDIVTVTGIRRRPELNGAHGEVVDTSPDEFGRITVKIVDAMGDGRKMKIQPFRLVPTSSSPLLATRLQEDRSSVRSVSRQGSSCSRALGTAISCGAKSALSNTGSAACRTG